MAIDVVSPAEIYINACQQRALKPNSVVVQYLSQTGDSFDRIITLDLSANYVGPNGMTPLVELIRRAPNLVTLNVSDNRLTNDAVELIVLALMEAAAARGGLTALRTLDLSRNPVSHTAGKRVLHWLKCLPRSGDGPPQVIVEGTLLSSALTTAIADAITDSNWSSKGFYPLLSPGEGAGSPQQQQHQSEEAMRLLAARLSGGPRPPSAGSARSADVAPRKIVFDDHKSQQQQQQQRVQTNIIDSSAEKVVGQSLDGTEEIRGRDRSAAGIDFSAFAQLRDVSSRTSDSNAPPTPARTAPTARNQAPATRAIVPDCFIYDGQGAFFDPAKNQQRLPWRPVCKELDGVSGREEQDAALSKHHDAFVKIPFFPAMPLGAVSVNPLAQRALLSGAASPPKENNNIAIQEQELHAPEAHKVYWIPRDAVFHSGEFATMNAAQMSNSGSDVRRPSPFGRGYDDGSDEIEVSSRAPPKKMMKKVASRARKVVDEDDDMYMQEALVEPSQIMRRRLS